MRSVSRFSKISVVVSIIIGLLTATAAIAQPAPPELPFAGFTCRGGEVNFGFIRGAPFPGIGSGNLFAFIDCPANTSKNPTQAGIYVKHVNVPNFKGARLLWSSQTTGNEPTPNAPDSFISRFCFRDAKTGAPFLEEIPFSQWNNTPLNDRNYDSTISLSKFSKKVRDGNAVLQNISLFATSTSIDQFVLGGEFLIFTSTGTVEPDGGIPGDIGCKGAKLCGIANLELLRIKVRQQR